MTSLYVVEKMTTISVRIDDSLKKEMDRLKDVNWSEVLRQAIQARLRQNGQRNLAKAVLLTEKIRKPAPPGVDSTEIIRYWREHR